MRKTLPTRRTVLAGTAATALAAPFARGAYAAGKLSVGFWDHGVPGANDALDQLCRDWADKEKVEISIDHITAQGDKLAQTGAAEAEARSGHDILCQPNWSVLAQADKWEPVDDLMQQLIAQHGKVGAAAEYLGKRDGHWIAVPAVAGTRTLPPCARIDLFKAHVGFDLAKMYPAGAPPDKELSANWTWDFFLQAAERCFKAGYPFGMPLGQTGDSVNWVGAVFAAHGAELVDKDGNIAVKSDPVRQVLDWFKRLVPLLPPDASAWDDSSNNKWLISGIGALIMNAPSAWAAAVRDARPIAEQCWTFPSPNGPNGRFDPGNPHYWGIWGFSANKSAAKSLLMHLWQRASAEKLVAASHGYDIPAFAGLHDFKTWEEEEPPKGTLYNYPPRGDVVESIAGAPAPPRIGHQIFAQATMPKMIAQCTQAGKTIDQAIDWAATELQGFMRS
jgi:ABC-type glycerol-3-phosphate transport system substrate-binding protein